MSCGIAAATEKILATAAQLATGSSAELCWEQLLQKIVLRERKRNASRNILGCQRRQILN